MATNGLDVDEMIMLAQELVRMDTSNPPGQEAAAARHLAAWLRSRGCPDPAVLQWGEGRASLIATVGRARGRPHLALVGHLDTVPVSQGWTRAPHSGELVDGRLHGVGAADMKGGLAAMAATLVGLRDAVHLCGARLSLVAVADEEVGQEGARAVIQGGFEADCAVMGEPTELVPMIAHKGDMYIEVVTHGVEAHAGYPERGVNAIDHMAEILVGLKSLDARFSQKRHAILSSPTLSAGTIEGGVIGATVPGECRVVLDRRVLPGETADAAVAEVRAVIRDIQATRSRAMRADVRTLMFTPAAETDVAEPVVVAARRAVALVRGRDPGVAGWSATSDANIFVNDGKIPTIILGPGSIIDDAHRPNESVATEDVITAARIYGALAADLLGLDTDSFRATQDDSRLSYGVNP